MNKFTTKTAQTILDLGAFGGLLTLAALMGGLV